MTERYRLSLLGLPHLTHRGQPVHGFESRKALALLCYLAARNEPLTRTHLADLFWADKSEAKGRANLSGVVHNLTTLLPHSLHADRHTIQIESETFWLDLDAFAEHARTGSAEGLAAAAQLYRDEFMTGMYLDDCPDLEVWLVGERERWRQRQASVLECLAAYFVRREDYARGLDYAARLLDLEPWREESHRQVMELLVHTGQRSAALQQFEICRRVLAEELGVEPSAETIALYARIRSEDIPPAAHAVPKHNLPAQLTSFVGRETDVARITARLHNPECRLLTLVGAGGSGKTRLALEAAANFVDSFRDGVYFVPLAALSSPDLIVSEIAKAGGFAFAEATDSKTQLLNYLRDKQMLLVLDNWEHLLRGVAILIELLQIAPKVKILATSREPLNVQAEWLVRVEGLSFPPASRDASESAGIMHYHAVQLFVERARQGDDHFTLNPATIEPVARICRIVEGMPLAIELAAAAIRRLPVREIAEQIASNLDLTTPLQDVQARHRSLRAVLDWSYGLLSGSERALFRRLYVFAGSFTLEAAEKICVGGGIQTEDVSRVLSQLADKSLLNADAGMPARRYHLHEAVREFARAHLQRGDELPGLRRLHLKYFVQLAERYETDLRASRQRQVLDWLEADEDNVRAALEWAVSQEGAPREMGLQLAAVMTWFWIMKGLYTEAQNRLEQLLYDPTDDPQPPAESFARALTALGVLDIFRGDYPGAFSALGQSVLLWQVLDDELNLAYARTHWAHVLWARGERAAAHALWETAGETFRQRNEKWHLGWLLAWQARAARDAHDFISARPLYVASAAHLQEVGDEWAYAIIISQLGTIELTLGNYASARDLFKARLAIGEKLNSSFLMSRSQVWLGSVALQEGNVPLAAYYFKASLRSSHLTGYAAETWTGVAGLAWVSSSQRDWKGAVRLYAVADRLHEHYSQPVPMDITMHARTLEHVRSQLDGATFALMWAEGRALTTEQAIAYVLQDSETEGISVG